MFPMTVHDQIMAKIYDGESFTWDLDGLRDYEDATLKHKVRYDLEATVGWVLQKVVQSMIYNEKLFVSFIKTDNYLYIHYDL